MIHMIPIIALKFVGKSIVSNIVESQLKKAVKKRVGPKKENKRLVAFGLKPSSEVNLSTQSK
jgi:hypothetical protein